MIDARGTESARVLKMFERAFDRSRSWHAGWGAGIEPWLRDEECYAADLISEAIDDAAFAFVVGELSPREALLFEGFFIAYRKLRRQVIVSIALRSADVDYGSDDLTPNDPRARCSTGPQWQADMAQLGVLLPWVIMAIYLISYDILEKNKTDEDPVLKKLKGMKATQCLYSEWLYESQQTAKQIADDIVKVMSAGDRLLVVPLRAPACRSILLNDEASCALLGKAGT